LAEIFLLVAGATLPPRPRLRQPTIEVTDFSSYESDRAGQTIAAQQQAQQAEYKLQKSDRMLQATLSGAMLLLDLNNLKSAKP